MTTENAQFDDNEHTKLADGSRWVEGVVVNKDDDEVSINGRLVMFCDWCGESTFDAADVLAVIRRAGLDPLYESIRGKEKT